MNKLANKKELLFHIREYVKFIPVEYLSIILNDAINVKISYNKRIYIYFQDNIHMVIYANLRCLNTYKQNKFYSYKNIPYALDLF